MMFLVWVWVWVRVMVMAPHRGSIRPVLGTAVLEIRRRRPDHHQFPTVNLLTCPLTRLRLYLQ